MATKEHICGVMDYYKYRIIKGGWKYIFGMTRTGYPLIFSLGSYNRVHDRIIVCSVGNWELRLEHEKGHARGEVHTWQVGYVMNPLGILRGDKW